MSVERVSPEKLKLALLSACSHASSNGPTSARGRVAPKHPKVPKLQTGHMALSNTARTPRSFNSRSIDPSSSKITFTATASPRACPPAPSAPASPACLELLPLAGMVRLKLTRAQLQQPVPKSLSSATYHHALNATTSAYLNDLSLLAEACRRGNKPQAESRARLASATTYEQLGLWERAIEHYAHYLEVSQSLDDTDAQCLAQNRIGICHLKADRSAVAVAARCHRSQLRLATGNGYARFVAYTNLGLLYQVKYAVKKREVEEKRKRHNLRTRVIAVDSSLACASGKGHRRSAAETDAALTFALRKALICHQKALDAALEDYARESETIAVSNLSVVNFQLEDWTAAYGLAERCLKLAKQLQNVAYRLRAMHNVAVATHVLSVHMPPAGAEATPLASISRQELVDKARAIFLETGRMAQEAANGTPIDLSATSKSGVKTNTTSTKPSSSATHVHGISHAAAAQFEELARRCRHSVAIAAVAPIDVDERLAELISGSGK